MFSREDALKIKEKVEREEVFLWKKDVNTILAREIEFYLYSNESKRDEHIKQQKELGWEYDEHQKRQESFHTNFFKDDQDVLIYVAYFKKRLNPVNWNE